MGSLSDQSLAIAVNSRVRDIIFERRMGDPRGFSTAFSLQAARLLEQGAPLDEAIKRALRETGGAFRRLNRGRVESFRAELAERLRPVLPSPKTLLDVLLDFKRFAERQLVHGFKKNPNEEYCRSNLQTYLEQAGRTIREVQSGGGWVDVVASTAEPIEAKLWRGREYYEAGIEELQEYMRTEGQALGYYVVFDPFESNARLDDQAQLQVPEGNIFEVTIRMNPGQPSKRRSARRKDQASLT